MRVPDPSPLHSLPLPSHQLLPIPHVPATLWPLECARAWFVPLCFPSRHLNTSPPVKVMSGSDAHWGRFSPPRSSSPHVTRGFCKEGPLLLYPVPPADTTAHTVPSSALVSAALASFPHDPEQASGGTGCPHDHRETTGHGQASEHTRNTKVNSLKGTDCYQTSENISRKEPWWRGHVLTAPRPGPSPALPPSVWSHSPAGAPRWAPGW